MMRRARALRWTLSVLAGLLVTAALAAPRIQADRFRVRIKEALEKSLNRRVELGQVRFNLLTGPGFTVTNVLIHENPAVGVEPFAHVQELEARVRLSTFWTRRLEFSKLTLLAPSVNLVKPGGAPWNITPLLYQTAAASEAAVAGLPAVEVQEGRLNFKFGDTKSTFYLANADVYISPGSGDPGSFTVRFSGQPARTDLPAQHVGRVHGSGRWIASRSGENRIDFNIELERSSIGELVRLTRGRDAGFHGVLATQAKISGPLSDVRIAGQLRMQDLHRWDFVGPHSGDWRLNFQGKLDWPSQRLELAATRELNGKSPVTASLWAADFMARAHWGARIEALSVPIPSMVEVARHFGARMPEGMLLDGRLSGDWTYDSVQGMRGRFAAEDSTVRVGESAPLNVARAEIELDAERLRMAPALVEGENGQSAELELEFAPAAQALDLWIRAKALNIQELQAGSGHLLTAASVPLLEQFRRGVWTGLLHYQMTADQPGRWSGAFQIRDVVAAIPGLTEPIRIRSASVALDGEQVVLSKLRARAGNIRLDGEYRYEPSLNRPHRFKLVAPAIEAAELERLLMPLLDRQRGFLARTLRLREKGLPEWLVQRRAEGVLRAGRFAAGDVELKSIRTRVIWDREIVSLVDFRAEAAEGDVQGAVIADFSGAVPRYSIDAKARNCEWRGGRLDAEGRIETTGIGLALLLNVRSVGTFDARSILLAADNPVRNAAGAFELSMTRTGPRIKLTDLEASSGTENFFGQGATLSDGRLQVELASPRRSMRFNVEFTGLERLAAR